MFSFDLLVKDKGEIISVENELQYKFVCLPCVFLGIAYFVLFKAYFKNGLFLVPLP